MRTILIVVALVLAIIAALLGFDVVSADGDPNVLGWLSASFVAYLASLLVVDR